MSRDPVPPGRSTLVQPGARFLPGSVLQGKYRIDGILSSGGMGVILVGTHLQLDQRVAIKVLRPDTGLDPTLVSRFEREARVAASIGNEHVVRVFDVGQLEDGAPFMVMEYLQGTDLANLERTAGPLAVADALEYVLQACEAIAEAHRRGIVHRDLKPANLFVTRRSDGSPLVKVLDFGISKLIANAEALDSAESLTKTSMMLGSPHYMSPEQLKSARHVDGRSDVWALGVVLYRLMTGKPAFAGETLPEVHVSILTGTPEPIRSYVRDVPEGLERVIFRCFEKDPGKRWPNVAELVGALAPFASARARVSADRVIATSRTAISERSMAAIDVEYVDDDSGPSRPQAPLSTSTMHASVADARKDAGVRRSPAWVLLGALGGIVVGTLVLFVVPRVVRGAATPSAADRATADTSAGRPSAAETALPPPVAIETPTPVASTTSSATATPASTSSAKAATRTAPPRAVVPPTAKTAAKPEALATPPSPAPPTPPARPTSDDPTGFGSRK